MFKYAASGVHVSLVYWSCGVDKVSMQFQQKYDETSSYTKSLHYCYLIRHFSPINLSKIEVHLVHSSSALIPNPTPHVNFYLSLQSLLTYNFPHLLLLSLFPTYPAPPLPYSSPSIFVLTSIFQEPIPPFPHHPPPKTSNPPQPPSNLHTFINPSFPLHTSGHGICSLRTDCRYLFAVSISPAVKVRASLPFSGPFPSFSPSRLK